MTEEGDVPEKIRGYVVSKSINVNEHFGEVLLAQEQASNKQVVVKKLDKSRVDHALIHNEVEAGRRLRNQNIVRMLNWFEEEKFTYLVFEWIDGHDLFEYMDKRDFTPFEEKEAKAIFRQLLAAVEYSHSQFIVHRDLKLENILLAGGPGRWRVKLIDFGLCEVNVRCGELCYRFCGSVDYVPPEILLKRPYDGCKADTWALGTTLYSMLHGQLPFSYKERMRLRDLSSHPGMHFPTDLAQISAAAQDLLRGMLAVEPEKRFTVHQVAKHRWLKKRFFWPIRMTPLIPA